MKIFFAFLTWAYWTICDFLFYDPKYYGSSEFCIHKVFTDNWFKKFKILLSTKYVKKVFYL